MQIEAAVPLGAGRQLLRADHPHRDRVHSGIVGIGKSVASPTLEPVHAIIRDAIPHFVGKSAYDGFRLIADYYRFAWNTRGTGSAPRYFAQAMTGIDLALWDAIGKAAGQPLHRLLGGAVRDEVRYFGFVQGDKPEEVAAHAKQLVAEGFRVLYVKVAGQPAGEYGDIRYEHSGDGIAKITIDRPEVRNAFRPQTIVEISDALERAREDTTIGVIVLTGEGPLAFCSGGDQRVRGDTGYLPEGAVGRALPRHRPARPDPPAAEAGRGDGRRLRGRRRADPAPRVRPHDRRRQRALRPDRAAGRARGTAATAPGCCATWSAPKKAKEFWFLCRQYDAAQALEMGLVNTVVPLDRLEEETVAWCREMLALSPFALRLAEGELQRRTRTATRGSSSSRTTRTSCSTRPRRRRRGATPTRRSGRRTSRGSPSARERDRPAVGGPRIWLMAARPRTLPAAVAPGARRHRARGDRAATFKVAHVRRRADRRAVHPGRDEPLQRLLRRAPRRRHRGPARARCA